MPRSRVALAALAVACTLAVPATAAPLSPPFELAEGQRGAPFGNAVPRMISNYGRAAPGVGIAGQPTVAGIDAVQELGFAVMVDLRQPDEPGVAAEAARAADVGLRRLSVPMPARPGPELDAFLDQLTGILNESANYPILLNCGTANRAAAAWTLYRARKGVPPTVAIEEGRALGLTSREALVREVLGLPPR
jgi:protein tyrosine phosphatase (PTP) superfamily phosphohydrolase (DUF442 family)